MKNTFLKHKFKNFDFVKPLYRKVGKVKPKNICVVDDNIKLRGNGLSVKRKVFKSVDFDIVSGKHRSSGYTSLPGTCEDIQTDSKIYTNSNNDKVFSISNNGVGKMLTVNENISIENKLDKSVQALDDYCVPQKIPQCWLKMYPAPILPRDSCCSIVFRCVVCQLGLASFLVLWTLLWVFIINAYEEPHEYQVSLEFQKQQNQLVIDLATELRQITPIAPRWLKVIERRMEDERQLTMLAVGRGAILHPGHYWHLAGTFLFTVYVMTALGFGAPVPQTLGGKTTALAYAVLAVPTHIYLMVNLSTCLASKVDYCIKKRRKRNSIKKETLIATNTGSADYGRNSEFAKTRKFFRRKIILRLLRILWVGRFVPLAAVLYYAFGAAVFGLLRGKQGVEVAMFPLEFTTSGGLEHVEDYVRFLYGFYVEGAMTLLSYMLATIKSYSNEAAHSVADDYQLFEYEKTDV